MNKQLLFFTLITLFFFSACLEDEINTNFYCEEKGSDLGTFLLMPESEDFWVYEPGQKLYFQDSVGNELMFEEETPLLDSLESRVVRTVCGNGDTPEREQDIMKAAVKSVHYTTPTNNRLSIHYRIGVNLWETTEDNETMYDNVSIYLPYSYYNFVSSKRGNDFDTPNYLWLGKYEQADTTLLGRSFNDVYFSDDQLHSFFNKEKGVVAFYDHNRTLFVLDRIE